MATDKKLTKKAIRSELAKHFRDLKRRGFAPPINAGGRRPWSWAPILAALMMACAAPQPVVTLASLEHIQHCTHSGCDRVVICRPGLWVTCSASHHFQCP